MPESADIVIIGGGISGVSLAARLAPHRHVVLLEAEDHLGTHATGRSAALLVEAYGPPVIRRLTGLSRPFFENPPQGFSEAPLARRRGGVVYSSAEHLPRLEREFALAQQTARVEWLSVEAVLQHCPLLKPGIAAAGFLEPDALDLDANALLQALAREARRHGATIRAGSRVEKIVREGEDWLLSTPLGDFSCAILVDAAGPWADHVAALAGISPRGLQPMRRTAATIAASAEIAQLLPEHPFVTPVDESFYFKPDAGAVMVSLSEETPSEPCDVFADDLDVAKALERFHEATIVPRGRPIATWAGLRTFAPDRLPVVGFDAAALGFFWYAGQGGYGIQTSPALSALGAKLILGESLASGELSLAEGIRADRPRGSPN
jgi:D-arginine dehydrogenase